MPITMANIGEKLTVKNILGKSDVKKFLESLGFVKEAEVLIVSKVMGNLIISVKSTRIAIDKDMAKCIMV